VSPRVKRSIGDRYPCRECGAEIVFLRGPPATLCVECTKTRRAVERVCERCGYARADNRPLHDCEGRIERARAIVAIAAAWEAQHGQLTAGLAPAMEGA
jgi:predicted amidophosphoribosyltransferase